MTLPFTVPFQQNGIPFSSKVWVKFGKNEKESHFIEVPFYRQKSVGREESRISVLTKILMTQKKTIVLFFLQLVPVPEAKLQNFRKTTSFRKTFATFKNQIKVPFY